MKTSQVEALGQFRLDQGISDRIPVPIRIQKAVLLERITSRTFKAQCHLTPIWEKVGRKYQPPEQFFGGSVKLVTGLLYTVNSQRDDMFLLGGRLGIASLHLLLLPELKCKQTTEQKIKQNHFPKPFCLLLIRVVIFFIRSKAFLKSLASVE